MGMTIVKVACDCALLLVKEVMGPTVGSTQFAVETKGGCALLQWAIQMALETKPNLAAASLDHTNAIGNIERECIQAAIMANPYLHSLIPLFELLYKTRAGELWFYDENWNFVLHTHNQRGVRQGCVLGMFLFCLTMEPFYMRLRAAMGEHGTLYAYRDDAYCDDRRTGQDGRCPCSSPGCLWEGWTETWL
jgi:hypothetical protein